MAEHEVRTKLTADASHANHAIEAMRHGLEHLDEGAEKVREHVGDIFKSAIGMAVGMQLHASVESMKEFAEEALHSAMNLEEQEKSIRGVLLITDDADRSFEALTTQAHEMGEQLADIGVKSGASKDSLISVFDEMAERTGMASEEVMTLTGQMADAGRAIPGGVSALGGGFSTLSMGIIRARNPIIQLIAATHMLQGNAKQVAAQLKKMSPEEAMKLGIAAIEKMGTKMKDVPLSFNEQIASLKALREQVYEALGTPMLRAIAGPLGKLRDYFIENKEAISAWAEEAGTKVGEWVTSAAEMMRDGFVYLQSHAAEIKAAIVEGFTFAKEVVTFLWEHRVAIAAAWAMKEGIGGAMSIAGGVSTLASGAKALSVAGAAGVEGATFGEGLALGIGNIATALAPIVAGAATIAAAAAAWAAAGYEAVQLWKETDGLKSEATRNYDATKDALLRLEESGSASRAELDRMTAQVEHFGAVAGQTAAQIANAISEIGIKAAEKEAAEDTATRRADEMLQLTASPVMMAVHAAATARPEKKADIKVPPNIGPFTGPITIHQDFKDQNPDRIMVMFKNGLARSAMAKAGPMTGAPLTAF